MMSGASYGSACAGHCFAFALTLFVGCGGETQQLGRTGGHGPSPGADAGNGRDVPVERCEFAGREWLDLERDLPGRWKLDAAGDFMEVQSNLQSTWGAVVMGVDAIWGRSTWSLDANGLVREAGMGGCTGDVCEHRFVRTGTTAVDSNELTFYALWPVDDCQQGVSGVYEGRERYETTGGTESEPRIWSEYYERLTLDLDGHWSWLLETKSYGSINDLGTRFWHDEPSTATSQDSGIYEATAGGLRFWTDVDDIIPGWVYVSSEEEEPVELQPIGRALPRSGVARYRRVEP